MSDAEKKKNWFGLITQSVLNGVGPGRGASVAVDERAEDSYASGRNSHLLPEVARGERK